MTVDPDKLPACPFCGEGHESGPVGTPGSVFENIRVCSKVPEGHFYEERKFDTGPTGRLHRLGATQEPDPDNGGYRCTGCGLNYHYVNGRCVRCGAEAPYLAYYREREGGSGA